MFLKRVQELKVADLPFVLVFLSCLVPTIGAFLDIPRYHIPAALVVMAMLGKPDESLRLHKVRILYPLLLLLCLLPVQLATNRGFVILGSGGYVVIFANVFYCFLVNKSGVSIEKIASGISFLYKFFIVGMLVEFGLISVGLQPALRALFHSATQNYKTYNGADVLRFLGFFQESGGLNSVLLGSQIAGMLSLFAVIWFWNIGKERGFGRISNESRAWVVVSVALLIVTLNATVFAMCVLAISVHFILVARKRRLVFVCVALLVSVGAWYAASSGYILTRLLDSQAAGLGAKTIEKLSRYGYEYQAARMTLLDYYIFEYLVPVRGLLSSGPENILFGVGREYLSTTVDYLSGDFGFGATLFSCGVVWMASLVATLVAVCIPALRIVADGTNGRQVWSVLGSTNGLITLLWLFSTIHYVQAFGNPGGMALFALHLSLTVYCHKRQSLRSPLIVRWR